MTRSAFILVFVSAHVMLAVHPVIAAEPAPSEPMMLTFDRACAVPPAQEELSGPGVARPRMTPKYPPNNPKYPEDAKPGDTGTVLMLLLVNEEGYVAQAKVRKSSGSTALDRASLEASRDWRLEPGRVNGEATCMWGTFSLTWSK